MAIFINRNTVLEGFFDLEQISERENYEGGQVAMAAAFEMEAEAAQGVGGQQKGAAHNVQFHPQDALGGNAAIIAAATSNPYLQAAGVGGEFDGTGGGTGGPAASDADFTVEQQKLLDKI